MRGLATRIAFALALMLGAEFVVTQFAQAQTFSVLYSFAGTTDGANPWAGLIQDGAGNLYGTTAFGGSSGGGVVFKLDATATETVLYSFTGGTDGAWPFGGLVRDEAGNPSDHPPKDYVTQKFMLTKSAAEAMLYSPYIPLAEHLHFLF